MENNDYKHFELELDCKEVKELLLLYVLNRGDLSLYERWAIEDHLPECSKCLEEYKQTKFINDALIANRDYLIPSGVFGDDEPEAELPNISKKQASYLQLLEMIKRNSTRKKRQKRRELENRLMPYIKFVSAAAACLVLCLCTWMIFSNVSTNKVDKQIISQNKINNTKTIENTVRIELLTPTGWQVVPASKEIATTNQLKKILINGNREMTLNAGTVLSIASIVTDGKPGCLVRLSKGEIYTHVKHDGNPFILETNHGRAVITGTTFNIKADDKQMQLIVTEGSVRFESNAGAVNVRLGESSTITANAAPSAPVSCDTKLLTAWAKNRPQIQDNELALNDILETELFSVFASKQINLEDINYSDWIEQKRDWFKREFPFVFKLKDALATESIEADYPELLIKSGLIGRFAYPEYNNTQLVNTSYESIKQLASKYNRDEKWLKEKLSLNPNYSSCKNELNNQKAFDKWQQAIQAALDSSKQIDSNLLFYSLHASVYLSNTRTFVWLALKSDEFTVQETDKVEPMSLLQEEINVANNSLKDSMRLLLGIYSQTSCDTYKYQQLLRKITENINKLTEKCKEVTR